MASVSTRAKSPTRAEAIAKALKPVRVYATGVLLLGRLEKVHDYMASMIANVFTTIPIYLTQTWYKIHEYSTIREEIGNWIEDRIECPKSGTLYFPPKEDIDYETLKPESRNDDFRLNRLNSVQGNVSTVVRHSSHDKCGNYATINDLVYNHLPKPLCGPIQRYYRRCAHRYYPQPDLLKCYGNVTEWGLKKYMKQEWACSGISDYFSSLYDDTYMAPLPSQYLQGSERKARNSSFTKTFRYKMTKPIEKRK